PVDIPRSTTGAGARRDFHHHIFGAITDKRYEASTKGGDDALAQFTIAHRLITIRIKHLFDEVILDNVGTSWLVQALENHNRTNFGHPCRIAAPGAPCFLQLVFYSRNGACWLTREDNFVDLALPGQVNPHLPGLLPEVQGIGGRGKDRRDTQLDNLFDARLRGLRTAGDDQRPKLFTGIMCAPEADKRPVAKGKIDDIFRSDSKAPDAVTPHLVDPVPVLHAIQDANGG